MNPVGVTNVGIVAPGIIDWADAREKLLADTDYDPAAAIQYRACSLLPKNERRRTTHLIQMALQCCEDVLTSMDQSLPRPATVFTCSCGDLDVVDRILSALTLPEKPVSPTLFHNSVHNAPAGYWSITTGSHAPSTSISAHDGSFAAGLLEAVTQVQAKKLPVLLIAYDGETPGALSPFRPLVNAFAVGLLLTPDVEATQLEISLVNGPPETQLENNGLEKLRNGNPAARSLPLLVKLASGADATIFLPYLDDARLQVVLRRVTA